MVPKITTLKTIDPLKVFLELDQQYEIYVAQCLQTGHLVTADDPATAKEMIEELLQEEVSLAFSQGDISNLLSSPAPLEIFLKWELAANVQLPEERTITIRTELPQRLRLLVGQQAAEVQTEIRIATSKNSSPCFRPTQQRTVRTLP